MIAFLGVLALSCMGDVAPGLVVVACRAVTAWAPYTAQVRAVRWCQPGECAGMGGGMFLRDSRVIAIDPDWPFAGDELLLTMEHEYGHALGLQHRWGHSIMKPGWDPPFAKGPTEEDFEDLRRMHGARAMFYRGGPHQPLSTVARTRRSAERNCEPLKADVQRSFGHFYDFLGGQTGAAVDWLALSWIKLSNVWRPYREQLRFVESGSSARGAT